MDPITREAANRADQENDEDHKEDNEFSNSATAKMYATMALKSLEEPDAFLCIPTLRHAFWYIRTFDNWAIGMRREQPALLDAMATFILTTNKSNKARTYEQQWGHCHLAYQIEHQPLRAVLHKSAHGSGDPKTTFQDLIAEMCFFLEVALDDTAITEPSEGIWPGKLETTLLPSGPKDAVLALRTWFSYLKDPHVPLVLCAVMCRFPSDSAFDTAFFEIPEFLTAILDEFQTVAPAGQQDPTANWARFWRNLLRALGPQKYSAFKELLRPNKGVVLFESIEKARAHFRKDKDVFSAVIHFNYMNISSFLIDVVPIELSQNEPTFSPYHLAYPFSDSKKSCAREGCPNANATTMAELQTCGGCRSVRYCSPICQQKAWKWRPAPHKLICKDLAKFTSIKKEVNGSKSRFEEMARSQISPGRTREIIISTVMYDQRLMDRMCAIGPNGYPGQDIPRPWVP